MGTGAKDAKGGGGATGASGTTGPDDGEPQAPRIRVLSTTFVAATTPRAGSAAARASRCACVSPPAPKSQAGHGSHHLGR